MISKSFILVACALACQVGAQFPSPQIHRAEFPYGVPIDPSGQIPTRSYSPLLGLASNLAALPSSLANHFLNTWGSLTGQVPAPGAPTGMAGLPAHLAGQAGHLAGQLTGAAGELVGRLPGVAGPLASQISGAAGGLASGLPGSAGHLASQLPGAVGGLASGLPGTAGQASAPSPNPSAAPSVEVSFPSAPGVTVQATA